MHWVEFIEHAQGVMIFENLENFRMAQPMTDASGSQQFRRGQKAQLDFIWRTMFPRSKEYLEEEHDKRDKFKANKAVYRKIQDDINRERGFDV